MEMLKNKTKAHKLENQIIEHQSEHFTLKRNDPSSPEIEEIEQDIAKLRAKIFNYHTHNMILDLHLDTAAPGCYPNTKKLYMTKRSRNNNNAGERLSTNTSTFALSTKPSGLSH